MDEASEALIARFRSVSLERLEQVETIWLSLMQRVAGPDASHELLRVLHTIKGDARILGFVDVHFLCHRLEELVAHAQRVNYRVSDDVDMIVMMAMRFVAVLLRKKMGASLGGIDLPGFARQIDEVLLEAAQAAPPSREPQSVRAATAMSPARVDYMSEPTLQSLAAIATNVYLECLVADDRARTRLRASWHALVAMIEGLASVPLAERVGRHLTSAHQLARDLGKKVDVVFEMEGVRVREEIARALDVVLLHGIRNAVDHGVECVAARKQAGKDARGKIRVSARREPSEVLLTISDDGIGIDREAIRQRASGLDCVSDEALLSLLFEPGFSTRAEVGTISGRGVGLNAVMAEVTDLGGNVRLESAAGRGTTLHVRIPQTSSEMQVHVLRASRADIHIAVPSAWRVRESEGDVKAFDPLAMLEIPSETGAAKLFELRRGRQVFFIRAHGAADKSTVDRRCATADGHPVEVVWNQQVETLLLRPEVLFAGGNQ